MAKEIERKGKKKPHTPSISSVSQSAQVGPSKPGGRVASDTERCAGSGRINALGAPVTLRLVLLMFASAGMKALVIGRAHHAPSLTGEEQLLLVVMALLLNN